MPAIKACLFDLDGVVVFTDKYHYLAWKQLSDEKKWKFDETLNHRLRGVARMDSLQIILDHNQVDIPEAEKIRLADIKNGYYVKLLEKINHQDEYPGAVNFIKAIRAKGIKTALCSSSKNGMMVLEALGLKDLFDTVITGHDIKKSKPDPEIFLLASTRLGVPPAECLVFEDAASGVEAALAAKMGCLGVGLKDLLPMAPDTFTKYEEIDVDCLIETGRKKR
jgi:beta-phosphoglucomutase